jgi:hypothetical protein
MRGVDLEVWAHRGGSGLAEDVCFQHFERGLRRMLRLRAQNFAKIVVNGRIVIDDQNAPVDK